MNPRPCKLRPWLASLGLGLFSLLGLPSLEAAQVTIFSEGFEGGWPSGAWTVGDNNPSGVYAAWDNMGAAFGGEGAHGGAWKAYCAGSGYLNTTANPFHRDYMDAYMRHPIDLTGCASAELTFWYKIPSIETGYDEARIFIDSVQAWTSDTPVPNWTQVTLNLDPYVSGVHTLRFEFHSDHSVTNEGWYVDDIAVTANWSPPNDLFTNCLSIVGTYGTVTGDNTYASKEQWWEPNHAGNAGGHSLWYCWTAPRSGPVWFSTTGSSFDTLLAVYTGNFPVALTLAASNDDIYVNNVRVSFQSRAYFSATAGTTYRVAVDGYGGKTGAIVLSWGYQPVAADPPRLAIARLADARIKLSWPMQPEGLRPSKALGLTDPVTWQPVNEPVEIIGDEQAVILTPTQAVAFYRLDSTTFTIPTDVAAQIATDYARSVWDESRIARGEPIPVADSDGMPFSYVFPFRRNSDSFPPTDAILETVAALKAQFGPFPSDGPESLPPEFFAALEAALGTMGFVQVSATRANYPVLLVQHCLHPYFLFQDSARARATNVLEVVSVNLEGFFMSGPQHEYFAFSAGGRRVFIHARTLEAMTPDLFSLPRYSVPRELAAERDQAWTEVLPGGRSHARLKGAGAGGGTAFKLIADYDLIPVVDWTYWCVPTAFTMGICFYDHYASGRKIPGFGRIVDYWYENGTGHNVPNFIDEMIDPTMKPPSWRMDTTLILNHPNWNGYAFSLPTGTEGNAANDWAWTALVNEINTNRPAVWSANPTNGTSGHAMTAFGYRVLGSHRFVIVYNTWGTTPQEQYAEYNYNQWIGGGASGGTKVSPILPGGATGSEDGILLSPRGGEIVSAPSSVQWQVAGNTIKSTLLYDSTDAGKNWTLRAVISTPAPGVYTRPWIPPAATTKGRVRIQCLDAAGNLVAGDGSVENVVFVAIPDLEPVATAPGYCNRRDGKLVVTVANRGPGAAPASTTEVSFQTFTGPQSVRLPTPAIPGNSSVEVLFDVPGACWDPDCNFEIRVDVLNQVNEANEANNSATGACVG